MKYLVTGATGFLGGALVRRLIDVGHEVVALVRRPASARGLAGLGVSVVPGDITDAQALRAGLDGADGLFHVAGWYRLGTKDAAEGWTVNVQGTRAVMTAALQAGTSRVVYTSTLAINSDTRGEILDEASTFRGPHLSVYDETKAKAHDIVTDLCAAGLPAVIVMPGMIYGPGDSSPTGRLVRSVLAGGRPFVPGSLRLCVAHVEDVVEGHIAAMRQGRLGESYMLAGPAMRFVDFLRAAAAAAGKPGPIEIPGGLVRGAAGALGRLAWLPTPEGYRAESLRAAGACYLGSPAKAERELGWRARSAADGIADLLRAEADLASAGRRG